MLLGNNNNGMVEYNGDGGWDGARGGYGGWDGARGGYGGRARGRGRGRGNRGHGRGYGGGDMQQEGGGHNDYGSGAVPAQGRGKLLDSCSVKVFSAH